MFRRFSGLVHVAAWLGLASWAAGQAPAQQVSPGQGSAATAPAATSAGAPVAASQPAGKPIIHADTIEHDFGDQWSGTVLEHTFKIYNRGDASLIIKSVRPGCGCTEVGSSPKEIAPGGSGDFQFSTKTAGFHGITAKPIKIYTNDPVTPIFELRLRGTFRHRIDVLPPSAYFGVITGDKPAEKMITLRNNTDKPVQLKVGAATLKQFEYSLVEKEPGQLYELHVRSILPHIPAQLAGTVALETGLDDPKTLSIPINARIPDRIDLYPARTTFAKPRTPLPGNRPTMPLHFWLTNYGTSPVSLQDVTIDDPALKVTSDTRMAGKSYHIQLEMPVTYDVPSAGRILTVRTNDPEKPVLTARILAQAPPPAATQAAPVTTLAGKAVPAFAMKTFDGQTVSSDDLKDHVTILNFVSPICGWCKKQIPVVEQIREAYQPKGVRFINVVNTNPTRNREYADEEITKLMDSLGSHLEIAPDAKADLNRLFNVEGYPTLFVVGKDNKIAYVDSGFYSVEQNLRGQLDKLLGGGGPAGTQPAGN